MSFSEVRPYQPGDDVRLIDWNVTARLREPYIKLFEEERELTLFIVADISASMDYGRDARSKKDQLIELAATLAFSAVGNNDKIGLLLFSDQVEVFIPPKKGKSHVMRIIRTLIETEPKGNKTNINGALEHLLNIQKRHAIVFLMSDFIAYEEPKSFKIAAKRYDLCAVQITDALEARMPKVGMVPVEDLETGKMAWLWSGSKAFRTALSKRHHHWTNYMERLTKIAGAGLIQLSSSEDYVPALLHYFKHHGR